MKIILVLLVITISLLANSKKTCYTVQLISKYNSKKNLNILNDTKFPNICKIMKIGNSLTVRCGCYKSVAPAKESLQTLRKKYKRAVVATTYSYRFDKTPQLKDKNSILEKVILAPMEKKNEPLEPKKSKTSKLNDTCYTVQLVSRYNSQKNLKLISNRHYPDSCKLMEIGKALTIRCGCFETIAPAKESLILLKKKYSRAAVTKTYKYRFEDSVESASKEKDVDKEEVKEVEKPKEAQIKSSKKYKKSLTLTKSDEELRLMLQVFLYKGDLNYAYKVATIGYEQNKESYYWNQKMAEICKWTNRTARSMKHLRFIYEIEYDKEIEQELIDYGAESYQYEEIEPLVVSRAQHNPTEENIDLMILVFTKIGYPEKVVEVLDEQYSRDKNNTMFLTKALELSLEMGDLVLAKKYVDLLGLKRPYRKKDGYLVAKYYYIKHKVSIAYSNILDVDDSDIKDLEDEVKYYQLKSDLGWYVQDNIHAASASLHLMNLDHSLSSSDETRAKSASLHSTNINKARLVDYERIAFVYQKIDPKVARLAIKKAYSEFRLTYLFFGYANEAVNSKDFDDLNELLDTVDEDKSPLAKEPLYWIIKAQVYAHYNQKELEKEALLYALKLDPNNYQTKLTLLWYFMDVYDHENTKITLMNMAEDENLDTTLYLPMAAAYFDINDVNRASYYTQLLLHAQDPVTELIEFKFLQAYIYQARNNESAFLTLIEEIVAKLKLQAKHNPELKEQDRFLSNYLRATIHIDRADKFAKRLKKAKKYLSKKNYDEIAYSFAMKSGAYEKSLKIYYKMSQKELWLRFSNDIVFQNHSNIEDLLESYLESLSMGDSSQAAELDGQIALSQMITFEGLGKNDYDENAYIHHLELSKKRSDNLDIKVAYLNRDPLIQNYLKIDNSTYLQNAWYLNSYLNYFHNKTVATRQLATVPKSIFEAGVGVKKLQDRGFLEANLEFHNSMESYLAYSILGNYRFSTDIVGIFEIGKNKNAEETTQLLLGGKKDMLSLNLIWNILNSTSIDFLHEQNRYSSQDGVYLGKGEYNRVSISNQIRSGYPDIRIGAFYDTSNYAETWGSRGIIDRLLPNNKTPVLPKDYYNMGINFSYGMANSAAYTRVWRPYFEVYPYYSSETNGYTYSFNAGYGGKVWHQDHLSIGASYSESFNGISGTIYEFYLNYQFMYYHP